MLSNKQLKNLNDILKSYNVRNVAEMVNDSIECPNCSLVDRCPVMKEYNEMEATGWWQDPVNTCLDTLENYIRTGMIIDKRKFMKEEEE